jgi:hypothetical protein
MAVSLVYAGIAAVVVIAVRVPGGTAMKALARSGFVTASGILLGAAPAVPARAAAGPAGPQAAVAAAPAAVAGLEHLHRGSSCGVTNCQWIEHFFPKGTQFWDLNGNLDPSCLGLYWSFYYYVPTGGDEGCSEVTSRWVTASWDNLGTDPVDGNIFAPGPSDC